MIAKVESTYVTINRSQRALAGLSMGGKQALEFALLEPGHFTAVGAFSAAIQERDGAAPLGALRAALTQRKSDVEQWRLFYLAGGANDEVGGLPESNRDLAQHCSALPLANLKVHLDVRGKHEWGVWRTALREFLCLWQR